MYADFMFQKKEFSSAKKHLAMVLAIDSSKYLVWEEYLLCYVYLEEYDSLELQIKRALEIFPEQANIYVISATALIQQKEYEKAVERLNVGKYFIGNNKSIKTDFFSLLGNAYYHLENYDLSDQYYEKAIAIDPKNLHLLNQYSYYLALRSNKLEKAEEMIKIALGFEPRNPSFLDTYGWILYKQKQYEEAEIVLSKAIELLTEENAEVYEHYGDVLFKTNKKEEALEYWKKAIESTKKDSSVLERKIKEEKLYE
jgi:Tfp pilus assembly protein PilF